MGCKTTLGDVCSFYRGASIPRARMHDTGDYLYIHYGDLYKGFNLRIDVNNPAKPIPYILASEKIKESQRLKDQDIIYVLTSETVDDLGHAYLFNNPNNKPAVSGTETTIVRIERRDLIIPAYLNYLMSSPRFIGELRQYTRGMKVFRVHPSDVSRIEVHLPSIEAQQQVVTVLDAIYSKQQANAKLNGYLAELQQAIYADSTKEGAQTTIGEIAEVIDCLHSKKPQRQPSGKPLIQLNNIIDDGILNMTDTFYISEDDYAKWISRCEVKPGDCVITNVGRIGAVSQVPQGTTAAMGRNMTCIRPGAYAATVITALCSNAMRYEIEKRTDAGTIMNALNVRNIPKLELYLPPAEVRDSVETTLKTIQDARELLLKERQEFAALRDVLLPKLMSGEIDVSKIDLTQLNSHLT